MIWVIAAASGTLGGFMLGFLVGRTWQMVINDHERLNYQEDVGAQLLRNYLNGSDDA